jgi:prophage maintenance system killer protein
MGMNTEYILQKEEIKAINEQYGGDLRSDAEIETALEMGKGKTVYKKIAYMWRAILVGHPFTDGNKSTSLVVALTMLERCGITVAHEARENMVADIRSIAAENIGEISTIERMIRYVVTGH